MAGMEIACADCGCVVDAGERVTVCGKPECCCAALRMRSPRTKRVSVSDVPRTPPERRR